MFMFDFMLDIKAVKIVSPAKRSVMVILSIFLECEYQLSRLLIQKHRTSKPLSITHHIEMMKQAQLKKITATSTLAPIVSLSEMFEEMLSIVFLNKIGSICLLRLSFVIGQISKPTVLKCNDVSLSYILTCINAVKIAFQLFLGKQHPSYHLLFIL